MSAKLLWKARYGVGLEQIDEQHQMFFRMLNAMDDMAAKGDLRRPAVLPILHSLNDYAFYHFACEEEYLQRYRYPHFALHRKKHDRFRSRIAAFLQDAESPEADIPSLAPRIFTYAREWLLHHILVEDKKCEPFFRKGNELPLGLRGP
ncbi:MAG: bacteriohemerythrin [Patescibacteria group bacterium]